MTKLRDTIKKLLELNCRPIAGVEAKCSVTGESFLIKLGYAGDDEHMTALMAAPMERSGYLDIALTGKPLNLSLKNGLEIGMMYLCPICGNRNLVQCKCGKLTCYSGGNFLCRWCGNSANTARRISMLEANEIVLGP